MLFGRYGTFAGGIDLPELKDDTLGSAIAAYKPRGPLRVPLGLVGAEPAELLVRPGAAVTAGELLARTRDGSVCVYAPLAGRLTGVTGCQVAGLDRMFTVPAAEIAEPVSADTPAPLAETFDWRHADAKALRERIRQGGLVMHRRPMAPLSHFIDSARRARCRVVIANALEGQPYVTASHRLLAEVGVDVVRGLAMLARAIEAPDLVLAVDHGREDQYRELVNPARTYGVSRIALARKYPIEADAVLVKVLTRRESVSCCTMSVGAAVVDVATCFAVYRWVACSAPPTGRVVTLAGERAGPKGNFWTPFGASCAELAGGGDEPPLCGGPMTGVCCGQEAVVSPGTDAVLSLDVPPSPPAGPCIRCGWCTDHCPARLNVSGLNDAFETGQARRAATLGATACLECGVCMYVCPAKLPLAQRVRRLKRSVCRQNCAMSAFAGCGATPQ
jgi:electron transport complex protein RnfC